MLSTQSSTGVACTPLYFKNWRVKQGKFLPYQFGDFLRFEIDQHNPSEIVACVTRKGDRHRLHRSQQPTQVSRYPNGLVEVIYYFTDDCTSRPEAPLGFTCDYKLCFHFSPTGKNICFVFQEGVKQIAKRSRKLNVTPSKEHKPIEEVSELYLGVFYLD